MNTYRRRLVVQDPKQIVLSDVPFQTGQEVEITLRSVEQPTVERKNELRALLKKTQSLSTYPLKWLLSCVCLHVM